MKIIKVSQAFIKHNDKFLLQLRDFKKTINFPGKWGFFAGSININESPINSIERELIEELNFQFKNIKPLGTFLINKTFKMHAFKINFRGRLAELQLTEGQEFNSFTIQNIVSGRLFSKKFNRFYSLSPISKSVFEKVKTRL